MIYGYARVSSKEQNLDRQIVELKNAGVEERNILTDKKSGKDFNRPGYNSLVGTENTTPLLREGDLLIIYSIDRLGRNYTEVQNEWKRITQDIKADIRVLDMPLLDTTTTGNSLDKTFVADLVLQILSYVANKERNNIKTRQAQGIAIAKENGIHLGRPKAKFPENWEPAYSNWKIGNTTATQCMKDLSLTRTTFYKLVKIYESEKHEENFTKMIAKTS